MNNTAFAMSALGTPEHSLIVKHYYDRRAMMIGSTKSRTVHAPMISCSERLSV